MRKILISVLLALACATVSGGSDSTLPTWFDYEHCAFCNAWASQPGLVAHSHDQFRRLENGIVWLTTVDSGYEKQFEDAMTAEGEVSSRLDKGEKLPLCQYCAGIGSLAAKGAKIQPAQMKGALVTVYTSEDSSVVRAIQTFGENAIKALPTANAAFVAAHPESK